MTTNHASSPRVVGLGLATLDILVRTDRMPTWEHGAPADAIAFDGGGMTGTAMAAVARLGVSAGYLGTLGAGWAGRIKLASLTEFGVDVRHVQRLEADEKHVILVHVRRSDGERVFSGVRGLGEQTLDASRLPREYLTAADYLLLDGFHAEAALTSAKWMREASKTVVYDGGKTDGPIGQATRELLRFVDVLICGEGFAPALTGHADLTRAGRAALDFGPKVVVQTHGAGGCHTTTPHEEFHTPAFTVEVVDTTGAGDVFHGAYLVGLAKGYTLRDAAVFASAVAALKCTGLGGRRPIPTFDQTLAFLASRGITLGISR